MRRAAPYRRSIHGRSHAARLALVGARKTEAITITEQNDRQSLQHTATNVAVLGKQITLAPTTNAPIGSTYEITCGQMPPGLRFDEATRHLRLTDRDLPRDRAPANR